MLEYDEIKDPVSGEYYPLSESDKKRIRKERERAEIESRESSQIASMLSSILK